MLAFSPSPYDFGLMAPGKTAAQTFTLTNTGGAAAAPAITLEGASAFTVDATDDMCTATILEPGDSCTVKVQFAPTAGHVLNASLKATSKKPAATATDALSGLFLTLVGETLTSNHVKGSTLSGVCIRNAHVLSIEYSVSGTATGPLPGTFTASGGLADLGGAVANNFTITSPLGTVKDNSLTVLGPDKWSCPNIEDPDPSAFSADFTIGIGTSIGDFTSQLNYSGDIVGHPPFQPPSFTETFGSPLSAVHSSSRCAGRAATMIGGARGDRIAGTRGADVIVAGAGKDRISAGKGNDVVCAGAGNDRVLGGRGNDRLFAGPGNDVIFGGPGNDRINPGPGRDRVFAGPGNDHVFARDRQRDVINCGPGHDVAIVDPMDITRHCEQVIRTRRRR